MLVKEYHPQYTLGYYYSFFPVAFFHEEVAWVQIIMFM